MNLVTKTIYYDDLILAHFRKKTFKPMSNTTLNEKFNINKDVVGDIDTPTLQYYAIGNGNLKVIDSEENLKLYHGNHRVIDGALFNHIPFIVRRADLDLGQDERRKYRMRKEVVVDNISYIAYYLKVIPEDMIRNQVLRISHEDDTLPKIETFNTNDSTILNPTPNTSVSELTDLGTEYITNSDQIDIDLSITELQDIRNGLEILGIPEADRVINEVALCSGTDVLNTSNYTLEVVFSQIMFFIDMDFDIQVLLAEGTEGLFRQIEIGGMNALSMK